MIHRRDSRGERQAPGRRAWDAIDRGESGDLLFLSPLWIFPSLWMAGLALSRIDLFGLERHWPAFAWVVLPTAPIAFVAGGHAVRAITSPAIATLVPAEAATAIDLDVPAVRRRVRVILLAFLLIGFAELAHQFVVSGSVPILSGNIDASRAGQPGGPSVVLTDLLTVATIAALTLPRRLVARQALPELAMAFVSCGGLVLGGGRGPVLTGLVAAALARVFLWGPPSRRTILAVAALVLVAVEAAFFYRTNQHRGAPFEYELYHDVLPGMPLALRWYVPIHVGLTFNFDVLARIVDVFPQHYGWGHGAYSLAGFDAVVPGARSLEDVAAKVTPPFITSTAAGPFFADFGLSGVVVGMAAFGAAGVAATDLARFRPTPLTAMLGGYVIYVTAFGVYANLYAQHPDWLIVIVGFLVVTLRGGETWPVTVMKDRLAVDFTLRRFSPVSAIASLTRHPRRSAAAAAALVVGFGSALVAQAIREGSATRTVTLPPTSAVPRPTPSLALATASQHLPVAARNRRVMTDGDMPTDNSSIWLADKKPRADGSVRVDELSFAQTIPQVIRSGVRVPASAVRDGADIGVWKGRPALFGFRSTSSAISVRITALAGPSPALALGKAITPEPRFRGARRTYAIATWSGRLPDLFVLTSGASLERTKVEIYSGESGFSDRIFAGTLPLAALDSRWSIDVARTRGRRPDVVAVLRSRGTSGKPEAHVVSGLHRYRRFTVEIPLASGPLPRGALVAGAAFLGRPGILVVNPRTSRFREYIYAGPMGPRR